MLSGTEGMGRQNDVHNLIAIAYSDRDVAEPHCLTVENILICTSYTLCHDHAPKGVGLYFLFTVSILLVSPSRTFQNTLQYSIPLYYDAYSRPF